MTRIMFFAVICSFSTLSGGPIAVAGGGQFATGFPAINVWTVSFFGSDELNSVSVSGASTAALNAGTPSEGGIGAARFSLTGGAGASIGGIHFSPGFFSFSLGRGDGELTGYDAQGNVVVSQPLISYLQVTSITCRQLSATQDCDGTFAVVPTPEPSSVSVTLIAIAALVISQRRILQWTGKR